MSNKPEIVPIGDSNSTTAFWVNKIVEEAREPLYQYVEQLHDIIDELFELLPTHPGERVLNEEQYAAIALELRKKYYQIKTIWRPQPQRQAARHELDEVTKERGNTV